MNNRHTMMKKVQQTSFAMIEAGLYLNNQPDSPAALELFRQSQESYRKARQEYEEMYGPLTYDGVNTAKDGWSWIQGPWPWEVED